MTVAGKSSANLSGLGKLWFNDTADGFRDRIKGLFTDAENGQYHLIKNARAGTTNRTDVADRRLITYRDFAPPLVWQPPYNVLRARFVPRVLAEEEELIFHGGEEILLVTEGQVYYHFFWGPRGKKPSRLEIEPLKSGSIVRVNSQIPHHTAAKGDEQAEAWMIFRHWTNRPAAINVGHERVDHESDHAVWRSTTFKKLANEKEPWRYPLVAWGLSERIRLHRLSAGLSSETVAKDCDITPSHLSRIERAEANVSVDTLTRLARYLGIGIADLIPSSDWCYKAGSLPNGRKPGVLPAVPSDSDHYLHLHYYEIQRDRHEKSSTNGASMKSLIGFRGTTVLEISALDNDRPRFEVLEQGDVIHLKKGVMVSMKALEDSLVVQVSFSDSHDCACPRQP